MLYKTLGTSDENKLFHPSKKATHYFSNQLHQKDGKLSGLVGGEMMFSHSKGDMLKRIQNILGINENDTIATDELAFGDNDQLSAHSTFYFQADILVILSDIQGYFDKNPTIFKDAKIRKIVNKIDEKDLIQEVSPNNQFATGGIVTKLRAAKFLMDNNLPMFLTSGFDLSGIKDFLLLGKHNSGTLFIKEKEKYAD